MIETLSHYITESLYEQGTIRFEEKEIYIYGFFVLISNILFFLITVVFGWICGALLESALFYLFFSLLRSNAGGFHASQEWICTLITTSLLYASIAAIRYFETVNRSVLPLFLLLGASISITVLCPLDTLQKPLSGEERAYFKKKTIRLTWTIVIIAIGAHFFELQQIEYAAIISILLESLLLFLGKAQICYRDVVEVNTQKESNLQNY